MNESGCTAVAPRGEALDDARLGALLARAARGDVASFLAFFDATCEVALRLELCRCPVREQAEAATYERYVVAWSRAGQHATSGLSPRAWLLSLRARR